MPRPLVLVLAVLAVAAGACGHKIGDACSISADCAQDGSRVCDTFSLPGGSCTIEGCDFGTCPDEAVCIRFFPALENAATCSKQEDCAVDEVCTLGGQCAPRSIEVRFCMLECSGNDDCRDGYECRDRDLMKSHGGEPVPDPTADTAEPPLTRFCAPQRSCTTDNDCIGGQKCDIRTRVCVSG